MGWQAIAEPLRMPSFYCRIIVKGVEMLEHVAV